MGRDKARLDLNGRTLVSHVADVVIAATGGVTLIGDPGRYSDLGYAVVPDVYSGIGPLGGIQAALAISRSEWNLIVACDMPDLEAAFLRQLVEAATVNQPDCLLPAGPDGRPEPLCGVYHRRSLPTIRRALEEGVRKVLDGLAGLYVEVLRIPGGRFRNVNTPDDWLEYKRTQVGKTSEEKI